MTHAEWHAEAMRLAEAFADASNPNGGLGGVGTDEYDAARAALSLHLLAYPVGEPALYVVDNGREPRAKLYLEPHETDGDSLKRFLQAKASVTPLYRNPKESA